MKTDITRDEFTKECIKRLKILKVNDKIIEDFEKNNILYVSEINENVSRLNDKQQELVTQYESTYNVKIFHLVHLKTTNKDLLYCLYVSSKKHEWKLEQRDLSLGLAETICFKNVIEIREVGIQTKDGKIVTIV